MVLAKPAISDSLKETRDKDSSLAAALKTAVFNQMLSKSVISYLNMQSRALPILSKRPEIRIPAWRQLSKRWFCESRALPILSKRPEIRIPAWRQL